MYQCIVVVVVEQRTEVLHSGDRGCPTQIANKFGCYYKIEITTLEHLLIQDRFSQFNSNSNESIDKFFVSARTLYDGASTTDGCWVAVFLYR